MQFSGYPPEGARTPETQPRGALRPQIAGSRGSLPVGPAWLLFRKDPQVTPVRGVREREPFCQHGSQEG